jgi:hypothetical protein
MLSSQERSVSIMTSWLVEVPQSPEGSFGARHSREVKGPGGIGRYVPFRQIPTRSEEQIGVIRDFPYLVTPLDYSQPSSIRRRYRAQKCTLLPSPTLFRSRLSRPKAALAPVITGKSKVPVVSGDTFSSIKFRGAPKSSLE